MEFLPNKENQPSEYFRKICLVQKKKHSGGRFSDQTRQRLSCLVTVTRDTKHGDGSIMPRGSFAAS